MNDGAATSSRRPGSNPPRGASAALRERYEDVCGRIRAAATGAGRADDEIILVAVTKFAAIDQIRQLIEFGHQDFGENRVQNLLKRIAQVEEFLRRHRDLAGGKSAAIPDVVRWHMIGHLQRNKVRKVVGQVRLIHSVDSLRLVEEIQSCAAKIDQTIDILIEVNVSGEKSKYGVAPAAVRHLVDQIDTMVGLRPRGLMCMAPYFEDAERSRPIFQRCRELFDEIRRAGVGGERFDVLSMGMSSDFEIAVECGANLVRVGSAIFGEGGDHHQDDEEPED